MHLVYSPTSFLLPTFIYASSNRVCTSIPSSVSYEFYHLRIILPLIRTRIVFAVSFPILNALSFTTWSKSGALKYISRNPRNFFLFHQLSPSFDGAGFVGYICNYAKLVNQPRKTPSLQIAVGNFLHSSLFQKLGFLLIPFRANFSIFGLRKI